MQIKSFADKLRNMKLSQKLIVSNILVVIIPVLLLGKISYGNYVDQLKNQLYKDTQTQLNQRIAQVKEKLHSVEIYSSNISHSYFVTNFLDGTFDLEYENILNYSVLNKFLVSIKTSNESLINSTSIFYTNPGIPEKWPTFFHLRRLDDEVLEKYGLNAKETKWLAEQNINLKGIEYYAKRYFIEKNEIVFTKPIVSEISSNFIGLVKTGVLMENLFSSLKGPEESDIRFMVTDKAGAALYDPYYLSGSMDISELQKSGSKEIISDSRSLLLIEPVDVMDMQIVANVDIGNTLNEAMKTSLSILWIIICSVAFSCAAVYFIVRLLLLRMKKMIKVIRAVSAGDFSKRVHMNTRDEMGLLAGSFDKMIDNVVNLKETLVGKERKQKEAEIRALQAQINPHFIYNTLEIFKSKLELKGQFEISNSIYSLGRMLRYSTRWSQQSTLKDELDHLDNYLKLQKTNFGDRVNVFVNAETEVQTCKVIKLLLQPLVENSIIHGMAGKNTMNIDVKICKDQQLLIIEVFDDGIGITAEKLAAIRLAIAESDQSDNDENPQFTQIRLSSIGLSNINERIKLTYGQEYGIIIDSEESIYTKVTVILPIEGTLDGRAGISECTKSL